MPSQNFLSWRRQSSHRVGQKKNGNSWAHWHHCFLGPHSVTVKACFFMVTKDANLLGGDVSLIQIPSQDTGHSSSTDNPTVWVLDWPTGPPWTTEVWLWVLNSYDMHPQHLGVPADSRAPIFHLDPQRFGYWASFSYNSLLYRGLYYIPFPWIGMLLVLPLPLMILGEASPTPLKETVFHDLKLNSKMLTYIHCPQSGEWLLFIDSSFSKEEKGHRKDNFNLCRHLAIIRFPKQIFVFKQNSKTYWFF